MADVLELLKDRYKDAVKRHYMSQIKGDILKEFLLAIHLYQVPGNGEILENDGSVRKIVFPTDDHALKEFLLDIKDTDYYLFIWNPQVKRTIKKFSAGNKKEKSLPEVEFLHTNVLADKPQQASKLSKVKELLEQYIQEFDFWGIIVTDKLGNPVVWGESKEILLRTPQINEKLGLKLVKKFVKTKTKFFNEVKTTILEVWSDISQLSQHSVILTFPKHAIRATDINNDYVLITVMAREQIGVSNILENKLLRELREILGS